MVYATSTASATTSDAAVTVVARSQYDAARTAQWVRFKITNTGTVPGFFSTDGGKANSWSYIPAGQVEIIDQGLVVGDSIKIKRIPGGSNMTGVYVELSDHATK